MRKILVLGSSGSGKSTLAERLGKYFNISVLHLDTIFWEKGWKIRDKQLFLNDLSVFVNKDSFIIDGNYSSSMEERLKAADTIYFLNYNRFKCYFSAFRRYMKYKNSSRPSMTVGCNEKIDLEFTKYILWDYPKNKKKIFGLINKHFNGSLFVFNNRRQLNKHLKEIGVEINDKNSKNE